MLVACLPTSHKGRAHHQKTVGSLVCVRHHWRGGLGLESLPAERDSEGGKRVRPAWKMSMVVAPITCARRYRASTGVPYHILMLPPTHSSPTILAPLALVSPIRGPAVPLSFSPKSGPSRPMPS
jgi:hypothetical protein